MFNFAWQPKLLLFFNGFWFGSEILNSFNLTAHFRVTCQAVHLDCLDNIISVDLQ